MVGCPSSPMWPVMIDLSEDRPSLPPFSLTTALLSTSPLEALCPSILEEGCCTRVRRQSDVFVQIYDLGYMLHFLTTPHPVYSTF